MPDMTQEEFAKCKDILVQFKQCLLSGDFDRIINEIYPLDVAQKGKTVAELKDEIAANRDSYFPVIDHLLESDMQRHLKRHCIFLRYAKRFEEFPYSDCVIFDEDMRMSVFGECDTMRQQRYARGTKTEHVKKMIVTVASYEDGLEPERAFDVLFDTLMEVDFHMDYHKSNPTRYIIYNYEHDPEHETFLKRLLGDLGCQSVELEVKDVSEDEWSDMIENLDLEEWYGEE